MCCILLVSFTGVHRYLHCLTHSFPTRRSAELRRRDHRPAPVLAGGILMIAAMSTITSRTVVLAEANIDTDQIIPARFLTTTERTGLGRHALDRKSTRLNSSH